MSRIRRSKTNNKYFTDIPKVDKMPLVDHGNIIKLIRKKYDLKRERELLITKKYDLGVKILELSKKINEFEIEIDDYVINLKN